MVIESLSSNDPQAASGGWLGEELGRCRRRDCAGEIMVCWHGTTVARGTCGLRVPTPVAMGGTSQALMTYPAGAESLEFGAKPEPLNRPGAEPCAVGVGVGVGCGGETA